MRWTTSAGKTSCSSIWDASGASSCCAKARTSSRMTRCSSVRSITNSNPWPLPHYPFIPGPVQKPLIPNSSPHARDEGSVICAAVRSPSPSAPGEGVW